MTYCPKCEKYVNVKVIDASFDYDKIPSGSGTQTDIDYKCSECEYCFDTWELDFEDKQ